MKEFIILAIVIIFLIFSIKFLIKAILSIFSKEELALASGDLSINQKIFLENNLEELEFDLSSKKIEEEEYKSLKEKILNDINSINKNFDTKLELTITEDEKKSLHCSSCKKELELDSAFCKYCGEKL